MENTTKNFRNTTTTEQRVRNVLDKKGRSWIVIETVTSRWYAKRYFEAVLTDKAPTEPELVPAGNEHGVSI